MRSQPANRSGSRSCGSSSQAWTSDVVRQLLGIREVAGEPQAARQHPGLVAPDQRREGAAVARLRAEDQSASVSPGITPHRGMHGAGD